MHSEDGTVTGAASRVREPSPRLEGEDLLEVMEVRVAVEVFCVEKLVVDRRPVTSALEGLLADQRALAEEGALERFIDCDRRFHSVIVSAAGNRLLEDLYGSMRDHQLRMGVKAVLDDPQRVEQVLVEHEQIVDAIARADVSDAREATLSHLYATLAILHGEWEVA